ncbi:hypothetical protein [Actinoplanes regularis]|uniref:hypothetical protein n=1 Tax=Actinoplanes regularis TaxID=52697 RepID=UPI0024A1829D|nr:hypothetical protein [Actinoplanes regularis]GLW29084.1 hypothetical protein Areg01_20240 [Actinoplanes regularis]
MNGASSTPDSETLVALVRVTDRGDDPEHLVAVTDSLRLDILAIDTVKVSPLAADPDGIPDGARAVDPVAVGQLIVQVGSSAEVIRQLVTTVANWWGSRQGARSGSVEVQIGDARIAIAHPTPEQQERLVNAFVSEVSDADR